MHLIAAAYAFIKVMW